MTETRAFGWTGVQVPVIGQGTWNIGDDPASEAREVAALRQGLDLGLTHLDTAEMYGEGRSERVVGRAIAGRRDEVFLASKVLPSNASYDGTIRACERSLGRLGTDRLDLYLLHWPSGQHAIAETMGALEALVSAGKTRFIGVSNFTVGELRVAQRCLTSERLACNQVLYHIGSRGIETEIVPYCRQEGIAVVGYSPFAQGAFPPRDRRQREVLETIGQTHGKTPRQVVLRFLTNEDGVFAIPKATQVEHVRENAAGAAWALSSFDLTAINEVFPVPPSGTPLETA
jgi:diketogulonate reductase-like aldo/keto reductase